MKRFLTALIPAVLALWAGSALAASVVGSLHDLTSTGPRGAAAVAGKSVCEYCHIPHAGGGKRLWAAAAPSGTSGTWLGDTTVAALCGSCHYSNVYTSANPLPHIVTNTAYANGAHGHTNTSLPAQDAAVATTVKWPYTDKTYIECSSCHNVHDNATRPFVRNVTGQADVQGNCNGCHARGNQALAGTLNTYTVSLGARSMHPTRLAYTLDGTTGWDINLLGGSASTAWTAEFANDRKTEATMTSTDTPLGGKLLDAQGNSGNMGCPTCHMVHGQEPGTNAADHNNYLTTSENYQEGTTNLSASVFCEKCHDAASVLVNAGANVPSHPVNVAQQKGAARFANAAVWTFWTSSTAAYEETHLNPVGWWKYTDKATNIPGIGCSSCHSAHNGVAGTPMQRTGGASYDWCASCHSLAYAAPLGHHSYKGNLANSLINCVDCHEGGGPANTALASTQAASAHRDWLALRNDNYSNRKDFCLNCHGGIAYDPVGAGVAFTGGALDKNGGPIAAAPVADNRAVVNPTAGLTATLPTRHGTIAADNTGGGTHYIGRYKGIAAANVTPRRTAFQNGAFAAYANAGTITPLGWTSAGLIAPSATNDEIICESCHSVLYNTGAYDTANTPRDQGKDTTSGIAVNLLLHNFADDQAASGRSVGSLLCVACHSAGVSSAWSSVVMLTGMPAGTHPVTGSTITKAQDSGLNNDNTARGSPWALLTPSPASYAQKDATDGLSATGTGLGSTTSVTLPYPAVNQMDCDSCHRVHDASTAGTKTGSVGTGGSGRHYILEQATAENNQQSMCTICHTY